MPEKTLEEKIELSEKIEDFFIKILGEAIYYPLWRGFNYIKNIPREIKYFFQRRIRGYDETCYWEIGDYLGREIARHLKHFRKMKRFGVPANICVDENGKEISVEEGERKWNEIIDKMISGFGGLTTDWTEKEPQKLYEAKKISREEWIKREKEEYEKDKANAILFIEYFSGLWDQVVGQSVTFQGFSGQILKSCVVFHSFSQF